MPKKLTRLRRSFSGKRSAKTFIVEFKENERQVEVRVVRSFVCHYVCMHRSFVCLYVRSFVCHYDTHMTHK